MKKDHTARKKLRTNEKTELSFIWLTTVLLLIGLIGLPAYKEGGITGLAVFDGVSGAGMNALMWVVLLGVVVITAFIVSKKRKF